MVLKNLDYPLQMLISDDSIDIIYDPSFVGCPCIIEKCPSITSFIHFGNKMLEKNVTNWENAGLKVTKTLTGSTLVDIYVRQSFAQIIAAQNADAVRTGRAQAA